MNIAIYNKLVNSSNPEYDQEISTQLMWEHFANRLEDSFPGVHMQDTRWRIGHASSQILLEDHGPNLHA
jgi:hypothetical protein